MSNPEGTAPRAPTSPSRRWFLATAPVAAASFALVGCSSADDGTHPSTAATNPRSKRAAKGSVADSAGRQWPMYGHDLAGSRTNVAETQITRETVARLTKGWELTDLVGVTGVPVVVDGVTYFTDWKGAVHAVASATGKAVWSSQVGGSIVGSVALTDDLVIASSGSSVFGLDRDTGTRRWTSKTDDHPQAQINASPIVVDDLVLQGTASFENMMSKDTYSFRGSIAAFDVQTGTKRWQFFSSDADAKSGAGAGIWSTPAVDAHRGVLYVGTGQSLAEPTSRYADSLLAIDVRTGKLVWSKQFTYPDVFSNGHPTGKDADVGASPNLWTTDGRDLVGAGDKGGTYHAVDRETGRSVWDVQLAPGSAFGGEIGSAAFVDGTIVATSNLGDPKTNAPTDASRVFGLDPATGKERWRSEKLAGKVFAPVCAVPGVAFVGTAGGELLAYDVATGEQFWRDEAPDKTACGPAIVDGRITWGYGFNLFGGPGKGGVVTYSVAGS
jgi:polyvinyl alcohol dehydrogenase (cytochrome)